jgi:hypothetical protein
MSNPTIEEGDQYPIRITIKDANGSPVAPSTLRYRVDCVTTGTTIIDWTALAASSSVDLTIPSSANGIVNNANETETKQVTAQANYGTQSQLSKRYLYDVVNNSAYV